MAHSSKTVTAELSDTTELLDRLSKAVEDLAGEFKVIRTILDEIQDDLAWAMDKGRLVARQRDTTPPMHITGMAKYPLSPDWAKLLNRTQPKDLPTEVGKLSAGPESSQQSLF